MYCRKQTRKKGRRLNALSDDNEDDGDTDTDEYKASEWVILIQNDILD